MKHPDHVKKYDGTLEDLATDVSNMRYDSVATFLGYLANNLKSQADYDKSKARLKLASTMYSLVDKLVEVRAIMDTAWKICEPYMRKRGYK